MMARFAETRGRLTEATDAERTLLGDLLIELEAANARSDEAFARLEATDIRATTFDEEGFKAEMRERLIVNGKGEWAALRAMFNVLRSPT